MRKITLSIILYFLCLGLNGCSQTSDDYDSIRPSAGTNDVAQANLDLGIAYLRTGEFEKSLEKLQKAQAADPHYPPIYNTLGVLYQQLGNRVKAEEYYLRALGLNGSDSSTLNNYGQFLCQESRFDEAEVTFLKAANNPLYATPEIALSNAGTCAMKQGKLDTAEIYFRDALGNNPRLAIALLQMAEISYATGNYLSARGYLQRYLETGSHTAKSLWLGIQIENELGDKNALSSYKLLLRNKFPDSKETGLLKDSMVK